MKIRYAIFLIILFVSCRKDQFYPFPWVRGGNTITYNFISGPYSEKAALIFEVGVYEYTDLLQFQYTYPLWSNLPVGGWAGENYNIVRKSRGIHKRFSADCGFGPIFSTQLDSLRVPSKPFIGDSFPEYRCGDRISNIHNVIEIKEVSVPLGTFFTFVMQDSLYGKKEYWDEKNGLIMIVNFDKNGNETGRFEAASRNF
ncbi:MAG: hypothetical protein IPI60_17140 [Saprospiraceae bacterium]|nr:hypothetical protein [Saprospiraceae bacterium]